jgi:transposase-like protein
MKCKYCGSEHVVKNGNKWGKQRYLCRNCGKTNSETDDRIKRPMKQRELALILYNEKNSMRSIQRTIEMIYDTKISINLIFHWLNSFARLLRWDINRMKEDNQKNKPPETIEILELDELYTWYWDLKKNENFTSKYGLPLTEEKVKLSHSK